MALVQCKSVRSAASSLGVHHATASRIDELESSFGGKLFSRTADGFFLSEVGADLFGEVSVFGDRLSNVRRRIEGKDQRPSGRLRVTTTDPIFERDFAPRLKEFAQGPPELDLELSSGSGF